MDDFEYVIERVVGGVDVDKGIGGVEVSLVFEVGSGFE